MRRKSPGTIILFTAALFLSSCKSTKTQISITQPQSLEYRFASESEGSSLITSYPEYFEALNSLDLAWRLKSTTPKTIEDYKQFRQSSVKEWNPEHEKLCRDSVSRFFQRVTELGFNIPETPEIVFVETSMKEEMGAMGYTHRNHIYLGYDLFEDILSKGQPDYTLLDETITHELFHCFTTNSPEFRKQMYSVIGFRINENLKLPKKIRDMIITNPDVPKHDSYGTFTINGKKQNCFVICLFTAAYQKKYANKLAFDFISTALVPLNDTSKFYYIEDQAVSDFYEVMGHNTGYTIDPEECLADNFSFLITLGQKNPAFKTPDIIDKMAEILKTGNY